MHKHVHIYRVLLMVIVVVMRCGYEPFHQTIHFYLCVCTLIVHKNNMIFFVYTGIENDLS